MKSPVFISYHTKNRRAAEWITASLKKHAVPFTGIPDDFEKCGVFIAFSSEHYFSSPDAEEVLRRAVKEGRRIVFLILDPELDVPYDEPIRGAVLNFAERFGKNHSRCRFQDILREINLANVPHMNIVYENLRSRCLADRLRNMAAAGKPWWEKLFAYCLDEPPGPDDLIDPYSDLGQMYAFIHDEDDAEEPSAKKAPAPAKEAPAEKAAPKKPASAQPAEPKSRSKRTHGISALIRTDTGDTIELPCGEFYIGSDPLTCSCCLEMPDVSDRHIRIFTAVHGSYVTDLHNPGDPLCACLNDSLFRPDTALRDGDVISLAGVEFIFRYL